MVFLQRRRTSRQGGPIIHRSSGIVDISNSPDFINETYMGHEIRGTLEFVMLMVACLDLLKPLSEYEEARPYIFRIYQGFEHSMRVDCNPPTMHIGKDGGCAKWYASVIAHEAYHSLLYHQELERNGGWKELASNAHSGTEAEKRCFQFQASVLRKLGATKKQIDHIEKNALNPTHHFYGGRYRNFGSW
jgi:hypothetical protein